MDRYGVRGTPQPKQSKWFHNIWFVLFMLFFVAGPFGLPLVWKNPRFSHGVKTTLTVVMVLYTIALLAMMIPVVQTILSLTNQFDSTLHLY